MNEMARYVIADLPAMAPTPTTRGDVMGFETADSVLAALKRHGLKVVKAEDKEN